MFKQTDNGIILSLKIQPNSSKNEIIKENNTVKVKITAQPIENKANLALIKFLAEKFKIPKSKIKIIKGETSREKTLLIAVNDEQKINSIKMLTM